MESNRLPAEKKSTAFAGDALSNMQKWNGFLYDVDIDSVDFHALVRTN